MRWFRDAKITFIKVFEYFIIDISKIMYCIKSLKSDINN